MHIFLAHIAAEQHHFTLSAEESKHCIKVLRHKAGDIIRALDGKGNLLEAEIITADPRVCEARVIKQEPLSTDKNYRLHLAISPTKNPDRIEWMIEKCTELGVDEFSFVIARRTEKPTVKTERLQKIAESALKQSMQPFLPVLNPVQSFSDFINAHQHAAHKYIAYCAEENKQSVRELGGHKDVIVLVGPEGDFTPEEIKLARQSGWQSLSLGQARLRTETAGLYIAAALKGLAL